MNLGLLLSVFGIIFVAELPDKTALATLVLATKSRPLPVFLGAALALTVQSLVAVAAGGLLALLPSRPIHLAAGALFVISALFLWRRGRVANEGGKHENEVAEGTGFWPAFGRAFLVIFAAEWGDITQLGTAALAARTRSPVHVFFAATAALWAVTGLAVVVGNRAKRVLDPVWVTRIAALLFALVGVVLIVGELAGVRR